MHVINIRNLELFFKNKSERLHVLDDINLEVKHGELVSFLGPSGCGKTSILRIIAGLTQPSHGKIVIDGTDISKSIFERSVSYVPQKPLLLPFRNVANNIALPLEINHQYNLKEVKKMLKIFSLEKYADYYPHQLSGGMLQRVSLARAMVTKPTLLLMDEPFSALDQITREELNEEFHIWRKKLNTTILFVTHQIEEAVYLSDRVVVLSDKPCKVRKIVKINLSQNRTRTTRNSNQFFSLSKKIRIFTKN
jgi:NitT/TauT family transport system ATP-binding protein